MAFNYNDYIELQYISADGIDQYIDTGLNIYNYASAFKLETKMKFDSIPSSYSLLFGTGYRSAEETNPIVLNYGIGYYSSTSTTNYSITLGQTIGANNFNSNAPIDINNPSTIVHTKSAASKNSYDIDGITVSRNGNFSSLYRTLKIFCGVNAGSSGTRNAPYYFSNCSLYEYFRIYNGETLVAEFIPAKRKSDGEVGLFETVSETFFTNQGTGSFTYGEYPSTENIFIRENGTWKKGISFIKDNGEWKKGVPYIKTNGTWKEGG